MITTRAPAFCSSYLYAIAARLSSITSPPSGMRPWMNSGFAKSPEVNALATSCRCLRIAAIVAASSGEFAVTSIVPPFFV